ncbi:MAG: hypothetical protein IH845_00795 [Nanoarchaeota archaeon]|nr:hypothetical protein [Nanoarchaeota archaeon]
MKHFFILGRNPELSREELLSYLEARKRYHKIILFEENILILETAENEKFNIQDLGGILKIGEITFEGNETKLKEYLKNKDLIDSDKFSYSVFGNMEPILIKEKFKSEKRKAILKTGKRIIKFQNEKTSSLPKTNYSLFLQENNNTIYYGLATEEYDYTEVKKRDMKKPIRREHLAISPRLSLILINLSGAKRGDHLLDPFCGIGAILTESILKNIKSYGIDLNKKAIEGAKQNLKWIEEEYEIKTKYTLENKDARKTPDLQFGAIATETPLGKVLRKKPSDIESKNIIQNFEAFIIPILSHLKKCKKDYAKIAITFPKIRKFRVNSKKIAAKTNLKIIMNPIEESRPDQFISRDIVVFR